MTFVQIDELYSLIRSTDSENIIVAVISNLPVDINRICDVNGVCLLHVLAEVGNLNLVRLACDDGGNENQVDRWGRLPIHVASIHGHLDIVNYLIESKGCDPLKQSKDGYNCLHYGISNSMLIQYLLQLNSVQSSKKSMVALDGSSPLLLACKAGVLETVRLLLEFAPGELLETDHNGVSCLSFACWKGHVDVVKLLLSQPLYQQKQRDTHPANNQPLNSKPMNHLNQQSKCGYTCLHYACVGGHGEIARMLVEAGVDEAIRDADGMQALDLMLNLAMEGGPKKSDNLLKGN